MTRRVIPIDDIAEQELLGTILGNKESFSIAYEEGVESDCFHSDKHQKIYKAMSKLYKENEAINVKTVASKMENGEELFRYLMTLYTNAGIESETEYFAKRVYDLWIVRKMIDAAKLIEQEAYKDIEDVSEYLQLAEKTVLEVARSRKTGDFQSSEEVAGALQEKIIRAINNDFPITGVLTGYHQLDRMTQGLQRGDLIIVAARPSVGKTALALNLSKMVANKNNKEAVAIFSLEMPSEQLMTRLVSADSKVDMADIKKGRFQNRGDLDSFNNSIVKMKQLNIYIDDSSTIRVSEIFAKCRRLKKEVGLSLIVIDYIQLIAGTINRKENRQQEVSEISRSLKQLARDLDVPVVALSQLSRSVELRENKRPKLSDLRESGSIEQDADIVLLLDREGYQEEDEKNSQEVEIIFAKHRNGRTGSIKMQFVKNINLYADIDNRPYE